MKKIYAKALVAAFMGLVFLTQASAAVKTDTIPAKPTDISPLLIGELIPAVNLPDAKGILSI
jgi:hypothetical protein